MVCTGSAAFVEVNMTPALTFREHLSTVKHLDWCIQSSEMVDDGKPLADAFTTGLSATILAVSDGSFKNTFGTAAWTIGTEEHSHLLYSSVVCPGGPGDQSAYRSELTGLYVSMTIINHLCNFYKIEEGQVELGCDGLSALHTVFEQGMALRSDIPDYNLVRAIDHLRKTSKVLWVHRHVKGQQDEQSNDLDIWAHHNVQMDMKAKAYLPVAQSQPRHLNIAGEPWQVWVNGNKLTRDIQPTIYLAVQGVDSEKYWSNKKDIDPSGVELVDRTAIGRTMRTIPRNRRVFVMKHVSGMCGVRKFMKCWKEWPVVSCPRCGEPEDSSHVWSCKGTGTEEI
jgi:hypothetical protein